MRLHIRTILAAAILIGLSAPPAEAFQDPPLSCSAFSGVPNIARYRGLAEKNGEFVIVCFGGTPTPAGQPVPRYTLKVDLNFPSASRILDPVTKASEALLLIDEHLLQAGDPLKPCPATGVVCPLSGTGGVSSPYHQPGSFNAFQGRAGSASNSIEFTNVPIDAPGMQMPRILRVTNIRADLGDAGLGSPIPYSVNAQISMNGPDPIPLANPQLVISYVLDFIKLEARDGANSGALTSPIEVNACELCSSIGSGVVSAPPVLHVRFQEHQVADALRTRTAQSWPNADSGAPIVAQNVPGMFYNSTESGFYDPTLPSDGGMNRAGLADSGTRFYVILENLPPGITAWASGYAAGKTNANSPIRAMQPSPASADGGVLPLAPLTPTNAGPLVKFTPIGGRHLAVFEFTGMPTPPYPMAVIDQPFDVAVYFSADPGVGIGYVNVRAGVGPVPLLPMAESPLPRFKDNLPSMTAVRINTCPACKPKLDVALTRKSGPLSARIWSLTVTNTSNCDAKALKLTDADIRKIGQGTDPTLLTPLPLSLGNLAPGQSTSFNIQFAVPDSVTKVKLKLQFDSNGKPLPPENINNEQP